MGFFLFILVNAALFLRPHEILGWVDFKVYESLIIACAVASLFELASWFGGGKLQKYPAALLAFAMVPVIFFSNFRNVDLDNAWENGFEFLKVLVYFVLLLTVVNTPKRLRQLLFWITLFMALISLLAVLQYHDVIALEALKPQQDVRGDGSLNEMVFHRLRTTGLFLDPNDFGSMLVVAVVFSLYWLVDGSRMPLLRAFWVAPLVLFLYTLVLTQSRGAMVALAIGVLIVLYYRFGPRAALLLTTLLVPLVLAVFLARQTSFQTADTNQTRLQQWQEGMVLLRSSPVVGVGMNQFEKHSYLVAHNSFMHCYGELGLLGGTLFLGAFFITIYGLFLVGSRRVMILDPLARHMNPYILGAVVGYAAALLTLSRSYVAPTYLILGIGALQLGQALTIPQLAPTPRGGRLVRQLALASAGFLVITYVACRLFVRYT